MWLFFDSSLILCFPSMLLGYILNGFEMVSVAPVIIGITFVFNQSTCTLFLYFLLWDLLSFFLDHISVSWNWNVYSHACSSFFTIADYNVRFIVRNVLSVCTCGFHNMVILSSRLFTNFGAFLYHCLILHLFFLHILKCSWAHTLSCLCMYCCYANNEQANIMWCLIKLLT